jgi:hypothetical protein
MPEDPQTKCIRPRFVHPWSWVLTKTTKIDSGLGFEYMGSRIRRTTATWWRLHKLAVTQTNYVRLEPSLSHALRQILFSAFKCKNLSVPSSTPSLARCWRVVTGAPNLKTLPLVPACSSGWKCRVGCRDHVHVCALGWDANHAGRQI